MRPITMKDVKRLRPTRIRTFTKKVRQYFRTKIKNLRRSKKIEPLAKNPMFYTEDGVYDGEWVYTNNEQIPDGMGVMKYMNNNMYYGQWKNGSANGLGIFQYFNGDIYKGQWTAGKKNGVGIFQRLNGDVYRGEWENDKKNGMGKYVYKNGDFYEGEWANDKFIIGKMHTRNRPSYFVEEDENGHIVPTLIQTVEPEPEPERSPERIPTVPTAKATLSSSHNIVIRDPVPNVRIPIPIAKAEVIQTQTHTHTGKTPSPPPPIEAEVVKQSSPVIRSPNSQRRRNPNSPDSPVWRRV